jgi:hypothetical protein
VLEIVTNFTLKLEAECSSETLVTILNRPYYMASERQNPQSHNLNHQLNQKPMCPIQYISTAVLKVNILS